MRNHFKYIVAILLLLFVSVSCTSNFEDVSKNPNASDEALPQALLAPALTSVVKANMSRTRSLTNELMQVTVLMGDIEGRIFRYDIRKSVADYLWNNWYVQLTNFKDMYETAQTLYTVESDKTYNTYMGISLICQCWVFSMLTDTYGDIPYTEACQGKKGILTPVFDRQEDIYTDIFAKLEQANELLANGSDLPEDQVICDPLFQGNALKWRKLSNSLYLRLLLRVSGKEEETAAAKIAEILEERPTDYPIMTSLRFCAGPESNPMFRLSIRSAIPTGARMSLPNFSWTISIVGTIPAGPNGRILPTANTPASRAVIPSERRCLQDHAFPSPSKTTPGWATS